MSPTWGGRDLSYEAFWRTMGTANQPRSQP